jgi:hypothetical protein
VNEVLSSFFCSKDQDIEDFLKNKARAIQLEKLDLSRTYLLFDEEQLEVKKFVLLGYFSLALNIFHFSNLALSKSQVKKFTGFPPQIEKKEIAVYLIGQLAKNDTYSDLYDGKVLLEYAFSEIRNSKKIIGGRCVMVESKNFPQLIEFYTENNFNQVRQDTDQLLQFIRVIG